MENVAENDPNSIVARHKAYVRLVDLLEQSLKNGMSKEQMNKILHTFESDFLGVGITESKPFMQCVKAYQDLSQLIKSWPKENAEYDGVIDAVEHMQERLLKDLKVLKTIAFSDDDGKYAVSHFLECGYVDYFTYPFIIRCPDFFDKRIAESIEKKSFSPAIAFALYAKLFDSKYWKYETPDVVVLSGNNFSGHILLLAPPGCCCNMDVYTFYANKNGGIEKIYRKDDLNSPDGNGFGIHNIRDYYYKWNPDKGIITFLYQTLDGDDEKDFKFIPEKKQWILHESRKVPYPYGK
ncbi:hypothetical protein FACS189472_10080 [Alphaproteobacteria bacterium]|nr:hypothetical protein FACS189472_10080 [Alphaproteobacteria bacterium]